MRIARPLKVAAVGAILLIALMVALGAIQVRFRKGKEGGVPRVVNGTYSFCFVDNGKQYYFEVLGWVVPNSTIIGDYVSLFDYGVSLRGMVLFLAVRTNLDWKWWGSSAYCRVGELYQNCFGGSIDYALRVDDDIFLIPYFLSDYFFWESYKKASEYYGNATSIRLYFEVYNFLGLEEGDIVKIGRITLTPLTYPHEDTLRIYVDYPPPRFSIVIENVTYLGFSGGWHSFNVTLRLRDVGMVVMYSFDEFGRKESLSEEFIPLYLLAVMRDPPEELWVVKRINSTHYLVAIPTASGHIFANRYHFGGGFEDVWREPEHEYIGSYAPSGKSIWLKIEVYDEHITNGTVIFATPWGQMYEVSINT